MFKVLLPSLLTLNIFHTFSNVSIVDFEQANSTKYELTNLHQPLKMLLVLNSDAKVELV